MSEGNRKPPQSVKPRCPICGYDDTGCEEFGCWDIPLDPAALERRQLILAQEKIDRATKGSQ